MEKEALLTIILQDIKELETLVTTFKGKKIIPDVFIQLSKSKTQGILDEIQLLAAIKETQENIVQPERPEMPLEPKPQEVFSTPEKETEEPFTIEPEKEVVDNRVAEKETMEHTPEKTADTPKQPEGMPVEPAPSPFAKNGNNAKVIGELLGKDKLSFNERLAGNQASASSKAQPPINDLRKGIGINDRFFFQRELFGGNTDLFNQTIDQLNNLANIEAALAFISTNFNWNADNEAVTSFITLLRRRFTKQ